VLRRFAAQSGSILLLNGRKNGLVPLAGIGLPPGIAEKPLLPLEGSITERVIREDRSLILHGTVQLSSAGDKEPRSSPSSALAVPLRCGEQVLGSLNVSRRGKSRRFLPPDLAALEILGTQVALAVENQRLLEQARENERLITVGKTTADISHSVKNLMTSLRGAIFLFEQGFRRSDQHLLGESLELLKRSVNRMQRMIGDLLDFSKKREPFPAPVRLADLFLEMEQQIAYRCREQNVELAIAHPGALPLLMIEEDRLFRALMNLMDNALDAMPRKGMLRLQAAWKSSGADSKPPSPASYEVPGILQIDVSDSGPGVAPELRDKVFETFFSTKGGKGTGLGLAMVYKFATESGGNVSIHDSDTGGALFQLCIPTSALMIPAEDLLAAKN
jgi:signal transduction histidine kinase